MWHSKPRSFGASCTSFLGLPGTRALANANAATLLAGEGAVPFLLPQPELNLYTL